MLLRRLIAVIALVCLGCSAQSLSPELAQRIERHVRSYYSVPASIKIIVGPLRPGWLPNFDALTIIIDDNGKKREHNFMLSKDGNTLLQATKMDLTKDPYLEVMKKINTSGRPVRGSKNAKVVVVSYDDFECPFCSRMHQALFPELLKEYGDRVQFVYKDFPLAEIHPWATHAAVDANCLVEQNNDAYWDFADYIHANQREISSQKTKDAQFAALDRFSTAQGQKHNLDQTKLQSCIKAQNDDAVKASVREGEDVGVSATPTLFVNGEEMQGALPASEVRAALDRALEQAGVPAPAHPVATPSGPSQAPSR